MPYLFYHRIIQKRKHYLIVFRGFLTSIVLELIYDRADAEKKNIGLTTWESAPDGKIVKADAAKAVVDVSDGSHIGLIHI